jgi:hypothetical protein
VFLTAYFPLSHPPRTVIATKYNLLCPKAVDCPVELAVHNSVVAREERLVFLSIPHHRQLALWVLNGCKMVF